MKKIALLYFIILAGSCHSVNAQDQYFQSDGVRIRFVEKGSGTPVILVHGFIFNSDEWTKSFFPGVQNLMDTLAKNHLVIAIDLRGHGKSDKPHGKNDYGLKMVKDIINLMDFLKIPKAHFLGHSLGATIVNNIELRYPERVISAVLAAGISTTKKEFDSDTSYMKSILLIKLKEELIRGEDPISLIKSLSLPDDPPEHFKQMLGFVQILMKGQDKMALACVLAGDPELLEIDAKQRENNEIPTLVIGGDRDPWTIFLKKYIVQLKNATLLEVKGVDHGTFFSNIAVDAAVAFINQH